MLCGEGGASVVLLLGGGGWFWSAEIRVARVAASAVLRRVVKSVARVGGRSAMMCGGDGGNVVVHRMMVRKWCLWVGCVLWWCVCVCKKIFFDLTRSVVKWV